VSHQWGDSEALNSPIWEAGTDELGNTYWGNPYGETGISGDPDYTAPVTDPPPGMVGVLQGWRYLLPDADTDVKVTARSFQGTNAIIGVWSRSGGVWTTVVPPTTPDTTQEIRFAATSGVIYYFMFALEHDANDGVAWEGFLLAKTAQLPAISMALQIPSNVLPGPSQVDVRPVKATVALGIPARHPPWIAPPLQLNLTLGLPNTWAGSLYLTAPENQASVPTTFPQFVVAVSASDLDATYTVEIQYADNTSFIGATTLSGTTSAVDGGVFLTPSTAVPTVTYWRARLLEGTTERLGWSTVRSFTSTAVVSTSTLAVTWTVSNSADRPIHLWHVDPDGPITGDEVVVYGQGFPSTGSLLFGDTALPVTSWTRVAASTDNAASSTRAIDGDTVTPEHYEIVFTAPEDESTGAPLTVEG
jgi:hypothetical protein